MSRHPQPNLVPARGALGVASRAVPLLLVAPFVALALGGAAPSARAADPTPQTGAAGEEDEEDVPAPKTNLNDDVRVIQQRPILKALRFEALVGGGIAMADRMFDTYALTGTGRFHISEWVSIGATYTKYFTRESAVHDAVLGDFELFPEISKLQWYAGGDVSVVAFDGKFSVFGDGIAYWDIYTSLGGGAIVTSRSEDPKPAGMIGIGLRLFMTEWMTLTFELRDQLYFEKFNAGSEFVNNVTGQAGLTFFIPFSASYTYVK